MNPRYRSFDIFAVIAITLVAVALVFLVPATSVFGRIWILPLVLLLPGYALTSALFGQQTPELVEKLIFSLGLSLAIAILGGLVLNLTSFGLRAVPWVVFLGCITVGASVIALVRRRGQSRPVSAWLGIGRITFSIRQRLLLVLAGLVVCGAVAVSIIGSGQQPYPGFTQLWILQASGAKAKHTVHLGVSNMESTEMKYRLDINLNGKVVKEWPSIELNPNEKWEATYVLPSTGYTGTERVEADLYRVGTSKTLYRYVVLWFDS